MRGYITKRSKNSYSIKISLGKDDTGKYKSQWVTVKGTKRDAEKRLAELLCELDNGTFIKSAKITVAKYLERWLLDYCKSNLSPRGYERYESIVWVHLVPNIGNITLTQLKPEHLQRLYTDKLNEGKSPLTVKYIHTVIHKALQTALKWGLLNRNAANGVDIPKAHHKDMQVWDDFEVRHFLEAIKDSEYFPLFYTALFTGARRSELLALRWSDIDFLFCQMSISRSLHHLKDGSYIFTEPKSAKSKRTIALSPDAIHVLREHQARQEVKWATIGKLLTNNDLVFSALRYVGNTVEAKPLCPNTVSRAWTMLATKAGLKAIRLHDARHTHATLMLKSGIHPKIVQERLGHASIQITLDTYSHVTPGLQEAAAARFDKLIFPKYNDATENEPVEKY